jgi:hypothetical protein
VSRPLLISPKLNYAVKMSGVSFIFCTLEPARRTAASDCTPSALAALLLLRR